MNIGSERSRVARSAAEAALVRIVHHYGDRPEFVVLGGLVPELLCSSSGQLHAGTSDIDVQVDLEIASGSVQTQRLERALKNAEFSPESERIWRWQTKNNGASSAVVKFELLADQDDSPSNATLRFNDCEQLGAANLRGTGYAARDFTKHSLNAKIGDQELQVDINIAGLAGFLLAKVAAAHSRRKEKDWYDIAFVLIHNNAGGSLVAASKVKEAFGDEVESGYINTALKELQANFQNPTDQGPMAYSLQFRRDHPNTEEVVNRADAVVAVQNFYDAIFSDKG
ncbi:MAG: hypothetical protein EA369_07630 [Bradymonadales bacterium]|nr:MAG: hypothetical protein EA369_07630 [Bradymonadales bacterium]